MSNLSKQLEAEINNFAKNNPAMKEATDEQAIDLISTHLASLFANSPKAPSNEAIRSSFEAKKRTAKKGKYKVKPTVLKNYKQELEIAFEGRPNV
jgi:hypothetical protein